MKKAICTVLHDEELKLDAYYFKGMVQPFPNHFHEHYVIGFVENGKRALSCNNREYIIGEGDIVLFNPRDSHACAQNNGGSFHYRGLNIPKQSMLAFAEEITGKQEIPVFSCNVIHDKETAACVRLLHEMVMEQREDFGKEELLFSLISMLIQNYGEPFPCNIPECSQEIEKVCDYMRQHFSDHIHLDGLCRYAGLSKSTLLRAFTKSKGITPYRYLETIRVNEAKSLLELGIPPAEVAARTGFTDQSHFTNCFGRFIGLTPGIYHEIFSAKRGQLQKGR